MGMERKGKIRHQFGLEGKRKLRFGNGWMENLGDMRVLGHLMQIDKMEKTACLFSCRVSGDLILNGGTGIAAEISHLCALILLLKLNGT